MAFKNKNFAMTLTRPSSLFCVVLLTATDFSLITHKIAVLRIAS